MGKQGAQLTLLRITETMRDLGHEPMAWMEHQHAEELELESTSCPQCGAPGGA